VRPSKHNLAAQSLSTTQVQINTRRVTVNAQVTAVISLIETAFNMFSIIIGTITVRPSWLIIIILNMTLYMVIIPYTFLMNTSDNKKRVVEYGWKNVFQNMLGGKSISRISPSEASNTKLRTTQNTVKLKTISGEIVSDRLFTTKSLADITNEDIDVAASTIYDTFDDEATTSNGTKSTNPKTASFVLPKVNDLDTKLSYQDTAKKLVAQMINHVGDSEQYIKYFKSLVAYQEGRKNGNVISELDLEKEFAVYFIPESEMEIKSRGRKVKRSKHKKIKPSAKTQFDVSYHVRKRDTQIGEKVNSNRNGDDIIILRKRILDNINSSNIKCSSYKNLVEELIDLEESFIE
jgi:hypothetical protein